MRPTGQMKLRVLAYLQRHQSATDKQAAKFLGVGQSTAFRYLGELCNEDLAHRTQTYNPRGSWLITFNFGPGPALAPRECGSFDSRKVVSTWTPLKVCDPWMLPEAFFKPNQAPAA